MAKRPKDKRAARQRAAGRLVEQQLSDDGQFEGYLSVFGVKDGRAIDIAPGAFARTLAEHEEAGTMPALLWMHDPWVPIGVFEEMAEDDKGLFVQGQLSLATQQGAEAHELLKMGALNGLSIGFVERDRSTEGQVTDLDLWEGSLVTFPANTLARVTSVQLAELDDLAGAEAMLRTLGMSKQQARGFISRISDIKALSARRDADDAGDRCDAGAQALADASGAADRLLAMLQPKP